MVCTSLLSFVPLFMISVDVQDAGLFIDCTLSDVLSVTQLDPLLLMFWPHLLWFTTIILLSSYHHLQLGIQHNNVYYSLN